MQTPIDKSKYKPTLLANLDNPSESTRENYSNNRVYLSLNPGVNKFRLYPAHPDGGGQRYAEPTEFFYVEAEVDEYENGEKTGQKVIRKKKVFEATTHSAYLKNDPIKEYIKYAEKIVKENISDENVKTSKLQTLAHFQHGLKSQKSYYVYAQRIVNGKLTDFGLLEIKPSLMTRLNQIANTEGVDDVMGIEPFTDIVDGFPILITYNKGADPLKTYSLEIDKTFDKITKKLISYPLSDSDLALFETKESLHSLYRNVYGRRDFEIALEGIQRYDAKHGFGVFEYDEFIEILTNISNSIIDKPVETKTPVVHSNSLSGNITGDTSYASISTPKMTVAAGLPNNNTHNSINERMTVSSGSPNATIYNTPVTETAKATMEATKAFKIPPSSQFTQEPSFDSMGNLVSDEQEVVQQSVVQSPIVSQDTNAKLAALRAKINKS